MAEKKPTVGMFGDFHEAHAFHEAISAAHQDHIEQLHGHHRALTDISDKSRSAAHEFTARDASTADSLRASSVVALGRQSVNPVAGWRGISDRACLVRYAVCDRAPRPSNRGDR
ncbi:MAG: DUF2563 family protein [Mycobacterium sp.]